MKKEVWSIEDNMLVCNYTTWSGIEGKKSFCLVQKMQFGSSYQFYFRERGTNYRLLMSWCNLAQCYTASSNNTRFSAFVRADLQLLTVQEYDRKLDYKR
jgi:hypothetical protein